MLTVYRVVADTESMVGCTHFSPLAHLPIAGHGSLVIPVAGPGQLALLVVGPGPLAPPVTGHGLLAPPVAGHGLEPLPVAGPVAREVAHAASTPR